MSARNGAWARFPPPPRPFFPPPLHLAPPVFLPQLAFPPAPFFMAAEGPGEFKRRRVGEPAAVPPPSGFPHQQPPRPLQPNDRARTSSSSTAEPPTTPAHENGEPARKPSVCSPNPGCSNCTQNLYAHANLVTRYERLKHHYEALQDQDRGHRQHISILKEKLEENKKGIDEMLGNDASRLASVDVKCPQSGSSSGWTAPVHTEPIDHREQAELKNKCAGLMHALEVMEKHADQQDRNIRSLENKIQYDDRLVRDLNAQIRALMREAEERRQRDAEIQKKMIEMKATDKGHAERVAEIEWKHALEMEKIKGDLESASARLKQALEAEKKRADELAKAKQECKALKAEQTKTSALFAQTRDQLVAETNSAAEERHKKEVALAEHKIRAHSLKKFQELTKQAKSFETQLNAALAEVERLKAESKQSKAEATEWKTKFEFRRQTDEATEKWTKKLQLMKEVHEQDVSKLLVKLEAADKLAEERLDGYTSEWQKRNDQNARLTAQILEQQKTITEQKAALDANRAELQRLNSELAAANAKVVADVKPAVAAEDKEKKELRDKIAFLEVYKKRLEEQEKFLYLEWKTAISTKSRMNDELKDVLDERDYVVQKYPHVAADMQQRLARRRAAKAAEAPSTSVKQE